MSISKEQTMAELEAKYKRDIEILTESTEMATIEKEIAEEKLDSCEQELKELKEKLADATLQIENLSKEHRANTSDSAATVLQLQKVEEQNELLRQALIKLRDISANDKNTLEVLQIEHKELQIKLLEIQEKEQRYLEQIKIFEEQIDIGKNYQEMIEKLSQQKTELEDKLGDLIDDLDRMEQLRDLNEQLLENSKLTEIDLNNDLTKMRLQNSELTRKKQDLEDYLSDQERTLNRLKEDNRLLSEKVSQLTGQFKDLEMIEQQKHQIENVAYRLNFSETKMAEKEADIARYKKSVFELEKQINLLNSKNKEQSIRLLDMKSEHDARVSECSELQRALKKKMQEVSELEIRKEMAEKKLLSLQNDHELKLSNLNRQIDTLKGIDVEREEEMKRLLEDNEIIERERRELRDQLNRTNRSLDRSIQTGTMVTAHDTTLESLNISFQSTQSSQVSPLHQSHHNTHHQQHLSSQTSHTDSSCSTNGQTKNTLLSGETNIPVVLGKMKDLSLAFDHINKRNYELEMELAMKELSLRNPTYMNNQNSYTSRCYDLNRARKLHVEVQKLKREVRASMINQQIYTRTKDITYQSRNDKFYKLKLAVKYQFLENDLSSILSNSKLEFENQLMAITV